MHCVRLSENQVAAAEKNRKQSQAHFRRNGGVMSANAGLPQRCLQVTAKTGTPPTA